jgi:hypothetical protein
MTATTNGAALEHEIGSAGRFHLRQLSGSIHVLGVDGAIARVRERNGRAITEAFQVETGEGSLSLSAPERFGHDVVFGIGRRSSFDLEIEVPRTAEVSIETASADLDVRGLTRQARIRTASGDVTLEGMAGALELDSVSGEVRIVAAAALDLHARTISGDLSVRAPRLGRAEIGTTSGDVRLDATLAGNGPFAIETVSGDATIVGRMGLRIEARTVTGDLRSDLPHRRDAGPGRKQLVVGDGAIPFSFRSVSGDLRVTTPRDTLPAEPAGVAEVAPLTAPTLPADPAPPLAPATAPGEPGAGSREVARIDVLRALERGEMSVEAAMRRLADIEEA